MYTPGPFRTDEATAWQFVAERAFGIVIAIDNGAPVASHVPLLVGDHGSRRLAFHVARANPLHTCLAANPGALVVVAGPDAYISPDWYLAADQVPTWNYVSVHLTGRAQVLGAGDCLSHVDDLSRQFEARLSGKRPWTTDKMTPARRDAMLRAIVPVEVTVERIEAQWKLGQHKTPADQSNVLRMLEWRGDWQSLALAEEVRRRGPAAASRKQA